MRMLIVSVVACLSLFAQQSPNVMALTSGSGVVYPIDPSKRGADIVSMVSTLTKAPYNTTGFGVFIQTKYATTDTSSYAPGIINGVIPYVQSITPATNGTLLIVTYYLSGASSTPYYFVLPVEQTVAVIYYQQAPKTTSGMFFAPTVAGNFSYYPIDLEKRAIDIQNVVNTLLTTKPYFTSTSQVAILTSLTGPFYPPTGNSGVIFNVKNVSFTSPTNNTLMLIKYLPYSGGITPLSSTQYTLVLAVEQVLQVVYIPYTRL